MAPLEFNAEFARLFLAYLSSYTPVNNIADNITFLQGPWKHTPPPFHHMLKSKFEAVKNNDDRLTTRYNVNKMPLFFRTQNIFNRSFVLVTSLITLV